MAGEERKENNFENMWYQAEHSRKPIYIIYMFVSWMIITLIYEENMRIFSFFVYTKGEYFLAGGRHVMAWHSTASRAQLCQLGTKSQYSLLGCM